MNGVLRKTCTSTLLVFGLMGLYPTFAQRANDQAVETAYTSQEWGTTRHMEIRAMTHAMPPQFVASRAPDHGRKDLVILFTFSDDTYKKGPGYRNSVRGEQDVRSLASRDVRIAFAYEGWKTSYPLTLVKNPLADGTEAKVYFLYYELPREAQISLQESGQDLEYRMIIDGIWTADPINPNHIRKKNGSVVSYVPMDNAPQPPLLSPEIMPAEHKVKAWNTAATSKDMERLALASKNHSQTVKLRLVEEPGKEIYVQGTFNHFDPYMNRLEEKEPYWRNTDLCIYEIELRLLPGQYFYTYYIDGKTELDPLNKKVGSGPEGNLYSVFSIP